MYLLFNQLFLVSLLLTFSNCNKKDKEKALYEATYTLDQIQASNKFSLHEHQVINQDYKEISGLVCGRKNENLVYMIEDKGNDNEVYVFNQAGQFQTKIVLTGLDNMDWEDLAIGSGPIAGETYIYIADIGDNDAIRSSVRIIRFIEPDLSSNNSNAISIGEYDIINFQYPTGAKDAETLMLDHATKDLIVLTKRDQVTRVYRLQYPYSQSMNQLEFIGLLPFQKLVAGDISSDGQRIAVKNKGTIYYWETVGNNALKTMFENAPKTVAYTVEPQGESLGFSADGQSYFTISETKGISGAEPILYHYKEN
jgi:hypothetical protein